MKVPVILLLSDDLMIGTEDEFFFAIVDSLLGYILTMFDPSS